MMVVNGITLDSAGRVARLPKSWTARAAQLTRLIRRARTEASVMLTRYRVSSDPGQALRASWLRRRHDALVAAGWDMVDGDRWML